MALKKCPECGEMISSTSSQCIHCGYRLRVCPSCGEWMGPDDEKCPNCSYTQAPPQPTLHLPHEKLKSNRGLLKYILWNFLSFGIYDLYFIHAVSHEANISCEGEGKKTRGIAFYLFLSAVTFGIYRWVWGYCVSERMAATLKKANVQSPVSGISWFLWDFFGVLLFGVGLLVAQYQLIHGLNEVNRLYSEHCAKEKTSEEQKILNDVSDFYYDSKLHSLSAVLTGVNVILIIEGIAAMVAVFSYLLGFLVHRGAQTNDTLTFTKRILYWIPVACSILFLSALFSSASKNTVALYGTDTPSQNWRLWGVGPIVARRAAKYLAGTDTKKHAEFCARFFHELLDGKYPQFPKKHEFYRALILYITGSYATEHKKYLKSVILHGVLGLIIFAVFLFVIPIFVPWNSLACAISVFVAFIVCMLGFAYASAPAAKDLHAWFEEIARSSEPHSDETPPVQAQNEEQINGQEE